VKKVRLEENVKEAKGALIGQDKLLEDALEKAACANKDVDRKAVIVCSKLFRQNMQGD
jgi:hypothetical protein